MPDVPKVPQTAEEARALADRLDADAEKQEETLKATRRSAAAWRAWARSMEEIPLTSPENSVTNETMNARAIVSTPPIVERRRTGPPINAKGIVGRVAERLGMSLRELAEAIQVNYDTVRVWNGRKSIPADGRAKLDKLEADHVAAKKKTGKPAK